MSNPTPLVPTDTNTGTVIKPTGTGTGTGTIATATATGPAAGASATAGWFEEKTKVAKDTVAADPLTAVYVICGLLGLCLIVSFGYWMQRRRKQKIIANAALSKP